MTEYIYGTFTVPLGQSLTFINEWAFDVRQPAGGPALALEIAGAVQVTATADAPFGSLNGVLTYPGLQHNNVLGVLIDPTGSLRVISATSAMVSWGIQVSQDIALNVVNHGLLEVSSIVNATAIAGYSGPSDIINTGTIRATSAVDEAGAVSFSGGGHFANSGLIEIAASEPSFAVWIYQGATSFDNSGTIRATDHTAALDSGAVYWSAPVSGSWTNSGTLQGDYALRVLPWSNSIGVATFVNTGTMIGAVDMGDGATRLVNSHIIEGTVTLRDGDDLYDGRLGVVTGALSGDDGSDTLIGGSAAETITGGAGDDLIDGGGGVDQLDGGAGLNTLSYATSSRSVVADLAAGTVAVGADVARVSNFQKLEGGAFADTLLGGAGGDTISGGEGVSYLRGQDGADSITGGSAFDDANGNMGDDTISTGAGDDWAVGGKDNDSLFGGSGGDVVWGNLGNDTQDGGDGNDQVRGGQGDDSITGGAGDDYVSGDRGNDTVAGGRGADLFHGSQDAGIDRVIDFNPSEGDRVMLDPGTTYMVSQVGSDTVISMGGGHQMILAGVQLSTLSPGWIFEA